MPRSLLHAILPAWNSPRRPVGSAGRRIRQAKIGLESLEPRLALAVAAPNIGLTAASDTGIRGDGITRLTRPVFTGTAPARSSVVVYADGQLLGIAKASVRGAWSLPTPLARPLSAGTHVMTAYSVNASQVWSTASTWSMAVDPTLPTASLSYDSSYRAAPGAPVTGRVTVTFSEPVQGVRLSNLLFTDHSSRFTVGLGSPLLRSYVGAITTTQLSDRSYAFTPAVQAFAQGTYTLTLLRTGIVDRAGNPLATGASTVFTII